MNLITQLLTEAGANTARAFTVCPDGYAYFKAIKSVTLFTAQKITLQCGKCLYTISGENLTIQEYFQGDILIKGTISGICIEKSL